MNLKTKIIFLLCCLWALTPAGAQFTGGINFPCASGPNWNEPASCYSVGFCNWPFVDSQVLAYAALSANWSCPYTSYANAVTVKPDPTNDIMYGVATGVTYAGTSLGNTVAAASCADGSTTQQSYNSLGNCVIGTQSGGGGLPIGNEGECDDGSACIDGYCDDGTVCSDLGSEIAAPWVCGNTYSLGQLVTYAGQTWQSTANNNNYSVYGQCNIPGGWVGGPWLPVGCSSPDNCQSGLFTPPGGESSQSCTPGTGGSCDDQSACTYGVCDDGTCCGGATLTDTGAGICYNVADACYGYQTCCGTDGGCNYCQTNYWWDSHCGGWANSAYCPGS